MYTVRITDLGTGQEFQGGHEGHGRHCPPVWPCAPSKNDMSKGHSGLNHCNPSILFVERLLQKIAARQAYNASQRDAL